MRLKQETGPAAQVQLASRSRLSLDNAALQSPCAATGGRSKTRKTTAMSLTASSAIRRSGYEHARRSAYGCSKMHVGVADPDVIVEQLEEREHALEVFVELGESVDLARERRRESRDLARARIALESVHGPTGAADRLCERRHRDRLVQQPRRRGLFFGRGAGALGNADVRRRTESREPRVQ